MQKLQKRFFVILVILAITFACQNSTGFAKAKPDGHVNINTATEEQLRLLPGVGEKIAKRIINYRTEHGNFNSIEDLKNIKGLTDKRLAKCKAFVILEGETTIHKNK